MLANFPFMFRFMVLNATFNNISAISWRSDLLVKETQSIRRKPEFPYGLFHKKWLQHVKKNVQIKLTPKNFLLIIFNVVYIEVNETREKL